MKKILAICIIGICFIFCSSCSNKNAKFREETHDTLAFMAEDLSELSSEAYDAYKSEDFEYMSDVLYSVYEKCKELSDKAENLADKYEEKEPDYDERRSGWY